jgi:hypothetical protein
MRHWCDKGMAAGKTALIQQREKPMARKKKQPELMQEPQLRELLDYALRQIQELKAAQEPTAKSSDESGAGAAYGIAHRTFEDTKNGVFRTLTTFKGGSRPDKIVFNFGTYGGGPTTQGGGPGDPPECP